jgi:hypothetical protein
MGTPSAPRPSVNAGSGTGTHAGFARVFGQYFGVGTDPSERREAFTPEHFGADKILVRQLPDELASPR